LSTISAGVVVWLMSALKAPNHRRPRRCALTPLAIKYGLEPVVVQDTDHYGMMREFCADPAVFVDSMLEA
jgi:hypothetical protein